MKNRYPKLFHFFGCYFHQDWMCESSDPDGVIRLFVSDSEPQAIGALKKEIVMLLAERLDEVSLRDFIMEKMPCNYCYWMEWESGAIWLKHILEVLDEDDGNLGEL
ncbi:contact-dependent growth inhibition system immunity protein [Pseudomonas sp. SMN5]|uniref:contact-dependent growth inhibition system immunity protein n=1 Tax=Pseudomonas sp. SMN5 TaxID=3390198 RepID=UPI003F858F7E